MSQVFVDSSTDSSRKNGVVDPESRRAAQRTTEVVWGQQAAEGLSVRGDSLRSSTRGESLVPTDNDGAVGSLFIERDYTLRQSLETSNYLFRTC